MTVQLKRRSLDLGLVTTDETAALAFYRDTLGLPVVAEIPIPGVGTVRRLQCGDSFIKMLTPAEMPANKVSRGGLAAATGYRYCTLSVLNLNEVVRKCRDTGYVIAVDVRELRPGVRVALIEDPDGNSIELMEEAG